MRWTGRAEGDLRPTSREAPARWARVTGRPVCWLRQVHGAGVVVVGGPPGPRGDVGDALVTADGQVALAVLTADCAPVALTSPEGVVGAAHAGWAGLVAGVLDRAVEAMRGLGATRVAAALGPCIRSECYEFGAPDLERVTAALDGSVRATTSWGSPALDLPAAVTVALDRAGAALLHDEAVCTACAADRDFSHRYFSHRARREEQRQAMVVWRT